MNAKARATLHLARPDDAPPQVRQLEHESDEHFVKRCASIHALGVRWVRSPAYVFIALHSLNPEMWRPAHALWWAQVHAAAAAERARNPAYQRAQRVNAAVGGTR